MGELDLPFPGSWAVQSGLLTRWELRHDYDRLHPNVYVRKGTVLCARGKAHAATHWAKGDCVVVGLSAAAMHGSKWISPCAPAELVRAQRCRTPPGIVGHRDVLRGDEVCVIDNLRVSTAARTAFDLGRRLPLTDAIARVDALANATHLRPDEVADVADRHPGARGLVRLRRVLDLVDGGAESPQETRTRLLLIDAGLPRPTTQIRIRDNTGFVIARADLGWPRWRVIVEYDGEQHWTDRNQRARDIDRTAILEALGWRVIRVGADLP